jgi:hypothetical protein
MLVIEVLVYTKFLRSKPYDVGGDIELIYFVIRYYRRVGLLGMSLVKHYEARVADWLSCDIFPSSGVNHPYVRFRI